MTPEERARKLSPCGCDPRLVALPCWEGEDERDNWCGGCRQAETIAAEIRDALKKRDEDWAVELMGTLDWIDEPLDKVVDAVLDGREYATKYAVEAERERVLRIVEAELQGTIDGGVVCDRVRDRATVYEPASGESDG